MSTTTKSTDIIATLGEWFDKFPPLPKNWRDNLARIAPVLSLVLGIILIIFTVLGILSLSALSPLAYLGGAQSVGAIGSGILAEIIFLVSGILLAAAYPGLKAQKYKGWTLVFWSVVARVVGILVSFNIIGAIISALIGFYLIFQIRSYFK